MTEDYLCRPCDYDTNNRECPLIDQQTARDVGQCNKACIGGYNVVLTTTSIILEGIPHDRSKAKDIAKLAKS